MSDELKSEIEVLKEKLLTMASHSEAAVNRSVRALVRRDDDLALQTRNDDTIIDHLQMEIDEYALALLSRRLALPEVRLVSAAMKIAHNLERVGDEATTISRRCLKLSLDPQLKQASKVPHFADLVLRMLKESLDAFVHQNTLQARKIIPRDFEVDTLNKRYRQELTVYMTDHSAAVERCLNLMVVFKSLERIADHAKNIAEEVVYLYEGIDIRHQEQPQTKSVSHPVRSSPVESRQNPLE